MSSRPLHQTLAKRLSRAFVLLSVLSLSSHLPCFAQDVLPTNVDQLIKKTGLQASQLHLQILPAHAGQALLSHQAETLVSPASTLKVLTSFIALDELGPNFRWKTQIYTDTPIKAAQLKGNLYLKGGGDPNFTWDKLSQMLRNLRQQGLREIHGDIVLDRSYFQPSRPEINAPAFDENPDAYYNVIPDALLIHSNISAFSLTSDNTSIDIKLTTPQDNVRLINQMKSSKAPCNQWKNGWIAPQIKVVENQQIELSFQGSFPKNCQANVYLNLLERNLYIGTVIRALWRELGGEWQGNIVDGTVPANAKLLQQKDSETFADTLRIINKFSDNAMTRIAFLTLGAESTLAKNFADTSQAANAVVREWFAKHRISDQGLVIENGSGLSRIDRISSAQLAQILRVAANSNWYPEFASSLPIVGVDGSMRNRLKNSSAEARARIKTGYLKNVTAIAGYVRDKQQNDWIVVAIMNTEETAASKAKVVLDEIIAWLASGRE